MKFRTIKELRRAMNRCFRGIRRCLMESQLVPWCEEVAVSSESVSTPKYMATRNCSSSLTKHVHLVSGGGEWGAKAGLLSLDPQIEYDSPSEAESLESFQSSFQGDVKAAGAIAKPGDIIQFFVEPAPEDTDDHGAFPSEDLVLFSTKLGVSDGIQDPELQEKQLLQHRTKTAPFPSLPFGGYSSEGIYLSVPHTNRKTKIDVPGSYIISGRFKAGDGNLMVKAPVKEGLFIGPRRVQSEMRVDTRAKATWREWDRGWDLRW